jgi:hypothetical protein
MFARVTTLSLRHPRLLRDARVLIVSEITFQTVDDCFAGMEQEKMAVAPWAVEICEMKR